MTTLRYTPEWQAKRRWTHEWSRRALLAVFAHVGVPETFLDVGCGEGHLVHLAARLGAFAVGVDVSLPAIRRETDGAVLLRHDLRKPLSLGTIGVAPAGFDMVCCWETAEHLPADSSAVLVETIARHARGTLVFTAAQPGQGGHGHVNEQPLEYWRDRFAGAGLIANAEQTAALRSTWSAVCGKCWWYPRNCQVFRR